MAPLVNTLRQADMPRAPAATRIRCRPRPCALVVDVVVFVVVLLCRVTHSLRHVLGQKQRTGHRVARSLSGTVAFAGSQSAVGEVGQNF